MRVSKLFCLMTLFLCFHFWVIENSSATEKEMRSYKPSLSLSDFGELSKLEKAEQEVFSPSLERLIYTRQKEERNSAFEPTNTTELLESSDDSDDTERTESIPSLSGLGLHVPSSPEKVGQSPLSNLTPSQYASEKVIASSQNPGINPLGDLSRLPNDCLFGILEFLSLEEQKKIMCCNSYGCVVVKFYRTYHPLRLVLNGGVVASVLKSVASWRTNHVFNLGLDQVNSLECEDDVTPEQLKSILAFFVPGEGRRKLEAFSLSSTSALSHSLFFSAPLLTSGGVGIALSRITLKRLSLGGVGVDGEFLNRLVHKDSRLSSLQELDFSTNSLNKNGYKSLVSLLSRQSELRSLKLERNYYGVTEFATLNEVFPRLESLRHLSLSGSSLEHLQALGLASHLPPQLHSLSLSSCQIGSGEMIVLLRELRSQKHLKKVDLKGNVVSDDVLYALIDTLQELNHLRHFVFGGNGLSAAQHRLLFAALAPHQKTLTHLELDTIFQEPQGAGAAAVQMMDDQDLAERATARADIFRHLGSFSGLHTLKLPYNQLTPTDFGVLLPTLTSIPTLSTLDFSGNPRFLESLDLFEIHFPRFASLRFFTATSLDLTGFLGGSAGEGPNVLSRALMALAAAPALTSVDFSGNSFIPTLTVLSEMEEALKKTRRVIQVKLSRSLSVIPPGMVGGSRMESQSTGFSVTLQ